MKATWEWYTDTPNDLFPCRDCEKRTVGCHSGCEGYLNAARINAANKNKARITQTELYMAEKMSQLMYKKKDLYDDVRACIREGLSIAETASLCGCGLSTVARWTDDMREHAKKPRRNAAETQQIRNDYENTDIPLVELAEKYGFSSYRNISSMARMLGWKKRRSGNYMRGGIISNGIDIDMLNAEVALSKKEMAIEENEPMLSVSEFGEKIYDGLTEAVNEEAKSETVEMLETAEKKLISSGLFKNFTANFDGKLCRYSIRPNRKVKIMIDGKDFELSLTDMRDIANEFTEIFERFGNMA